jgi:hypothetical protein
MGTRTYYPKATTPEPGRKRISTPNQDEELKNRLSQNPFESICGFSYRFS